MRKLAAATPLFIALSSGIFLCPLMAEPDQSGTPQVGYAVISTGSGISGTSASLQIFEIFGFPQAGIFERAEVPAAQMTTSALLLVTTSNTLGRNTGIAISNPGFSLAQVDMTLRRNDGIIVAIKTILVPSKSQISQLLTQIFSDRPGLLTEFTGTLSLVSSQPVAIVALRFRDNAFSTETVSGLSAPSPVPPVVIGVGAGSQSFILPNFVSGGGWATEIVILNAGNTPTSVRLDLFSSNGSPMTASLNGLTGSTFDGLTIQAGGVLIIAPLDSQGNSPF